MKISIVTMLIASLTLIAGTIWAADPVQLTLKPASQVLELSRTRSTTQDGKALSNVVQEFIRSEAAVEANTKLTTTIKRVQLDMQTPAGKALKVDTGNKEAAVGIDNPMAKTMVRGLDDIVGKALSLTVDPTGKIIEKKSIEEIEKSVLGCGGGPGLCTQLIMEVEQSAQIDRKLLPAKPVAEGESWTVDLPITISAGNELPFPTTMKVTAIKDGLATVTGDMQIDPKAFPASESGQVTAAKGSVEYTFNIAQGYFTAQKFSISLDLSTGKEKPSQVVMESMIKLTKPAQ